MQIFPWPRTRRRTVLVLAYATVMASLFLRTTSAAAQAPATAVRTSAFRFHPVNEHSLGLWEGNQPVLVYNHGLIATPPGAAGRARSAYFHPIYGLNGEVLTDDFPKDHDYHRGLYWAWSHITVADKEYDSWSLRGIRTEFGRWIAKQTDAQSARMEVENAWYVGTQPVMRERLQARVHPATADARAIDLEITWTPLAGPVTLRGAEGKSYGGLTFRYGPRTKTIITVPDGQAKDDLLMTRLPWADLTGDFKGAPSLSGAAVFVHPQHPDYPPTWMTRDYGVLAVGWPGVNAQTLTADRPVTCAYRIWIHRQAASAGEIQKAYETYRTEEKRSPP